MNTKLPERSPRRPNEPDPICPQTEASKRQRGAVAKWILWFRDQGYITRLLNWRPWENPGYQSKALLVAVRCGTREQKVICVRLPRKEFFLPEEED